MNTGQNRKRSIEPRRHKVHQEDVFITKWWQVLALRYGPGKCEAIMLGLPRKDEFLLGALCAFVVIKKIIILRLSRLRPGGKHAKLIGLKPFPGYVRLNWKSQKSCLILKLRSWKIFQFQNWKISDPNWIKIYQTANIKINMAIENMQDKSGYFYYRKYPLFTNKIPFIRWAQGWMMLALSEVLLGCEGKRERGKERRWEDEKVRR